IGATVRLPGLFVYDGCETSTHADQLGTVHSPEAGKGAEITRAGRYQMEAQAPNDIYFIGVTLEQRDRQSCPSEQCGMVSPQKVSTTISISRQAPNGICATPKALRACAPRSPKISRKNSDAPFATTCGSVKCGALFTSTWSFTIRLILFRSPRAA